MVLSLALFSALTPAWLLYLGLGFMLVVIHLPGGLASLASATLHQDLMRRWRRAPGTCTAWLAGLMLSATGFAALVELAYQWHLRSTLGDMLHFLGVSLDAGAPGSWLAAAAVASVGALGTRWFARRLTPTQFVP
jgi:branched-chain amino acid transport system permease protein